MKESFFCGEKEPITVFCFDPFLLFSEFVFP